ncbi:flagellar hook-associated protein FlgL [Desulfococcus sp.]|uniref:flagellar hook-associated protein FlgL n=1 Tax=Desulfococcus sp. TaxID=2025834 RepID=UPI003593BD98
MRVTNRMMTDAVSANMHKQSERLLSLQETASTGKKVLRPSDDPLTAGRILEYRADISATDQYLTNITHAETRMEMTEDVLETMNGFIETLWGFAADPSSRSPLDRSTAADHIRDLKEQVRQLANSRHGGGYLFAGHLTDEPPFPDDNTYAGDAGEASIIIGKGMDMKINTPGSELFAVGPDGRVALFAALDELEAAYRQDPFDPSAVTEETAATILDAVNQVKEIRAGNAARLSRMGSARNFLEGIRPRLATVLADAEDADVSAAIVEMKLQETAYETALQTASRVIQPTLLDFLQ